MSFLTESLRRRELGYLPLPTEAASALFQVVSPRYLKSSIVLTTNRPVSWGEILGRHHRRGRALGSAVAPLRGAHLLDVLDGFPRRADGVADGGEPAKIALGFCSS